MGAKGRGLQSKRMLADALMELLEEHAFGEITVKDIAEKAGVARLTFYRHFETKNEVLAFRSRDLFEGYIVELEDLGTSGLLDALTLCFSWWERNARQIMLMQHRGLESELYAPIGDYMDTLLARYDVFRHANAFQRRFLAGGLCFSMIAYATDQNRPSPKQAAMDILHMLAIE